MLETLDSINWGTLTHAYGSAADVPVTLRDLASGHIGTQEAANTFFGNIWHQGTVYQATSYTVPFLLELLDAPSIPDKQWLLLLLASLASAGAPSEDDDEEEDEEDEELDVSNAHRTLWEQQTKDAVALGIPSFLSFVDNGNTAESVAAARVLGCFPEHESQISPRLFARLSSMADPNTQASLLLCLNALNTADRRFPSALEQAVRRTAHMPPRLAAAIIRAHRQQGGTPAHVRDCLVELIAPLDNGAPLVFQVWEMEGRHVCKALRECGDDYALETFLTILPTVADDLAGYSVVEALLEIVFPVTPSSAPTSFTPAQRRVLTACINCLPLWNGNAMRTLEWDYHLPSNRERLSQLLGPGR